VRAWDFLFYASFGLMVTQSVRLAGVLVVFSYLIIPAVCAGLLARGFRARLLIAWAVALVASVVGLFFSAAKDMPTGPSLVATFGAILVTTAVVQPLFAMLLSRAPSR
jgi:zinc/manganese transport system permease protein